MASRQNCILTLASVLRFLLILRTGSAWNDAMLSAAEPDVSDIRLDVVTASSDFVLTEAEDSADIQLRVSFSGETDRGISLYDCVAVSEAGDQNVQLTDSRGCPAQKSPMGCMKAEENGTVVSPTFQLSSLADAGHVNITCSWESCLSSHHPKCMDRCSFFTAQHSERGHRDKMAAQHSEQGHRDKMVAQHSEQGHRDKMAAQHSEQGHRDKMAAQHSEQGHRDKMAAQHSEQGHRDKMAAQHSEQGHRDKMAAQHRRPRRDSEESPGRHYISTTIRVLPSHVRRAQRPNIGHHMHHAASGHMASPELSGMDPRYGHDIVTVQTSPLLYLNPITCSVLLLVLAVFLGLFVSFVRSLRHSVEDIKREIDVQRARDKFLIA